MEPRFDSDTGSADAVMERLTPIGRAVVLAFAAGYAQLTDKRAEIAMAIAHRCVLQTGYSARTLARSLGIGDHKLVGRACDRFSAFLAEMVKSGRLDPRAMLER